MAAVTIAELFASHVPRRMQIMSSGDNLEGHFQAVFPHFPTNFQHFLFMNWECHLSISGPRPSQKLSSRLFVLRICREQLRNPPGAWNN